MTPLVCKQRGATLFVTLIALVILTLLAVVAIRAGTVGLRIGGNAQTALEAEAAAQAGIDQFIGDINNFVNPPTGNTAMPAVGVGGRSYSVTVQSPRCQSSTIAPGYSLVVKPGQGGAPMDQIWRISATADESILGVLVNGASVNVVQGVKVRMPPGATCPN